MKKTLYIVLIACLLAPFAQAQDSLSQATETVEAQEPMANKTINKAMADSAYAKGDYASAIDIYEQILTHQGEAAAIYYNLGNSYYKQGNVAKSILNLERAYLLNPGDTDTRFNLEMAKSKAVDKVETVGEFFLISWVSSVRNLFSADEWAGGAIGLFIILLIALAAYIFGKSLMWKKIGFAGAVICLILVIVANVFATQQKDLLVNRQSAIIMAPSVTAKSTPDVTGTDLFILHEGHKVQIKDQTMKEWYEIQLEDGSIGWIPVESLEII